MKPLTVPLGGLGAVSVDDPLCVIVCAYCNQTFNASAFASHIARCKKDNVLKAPPPTSRPDVTAVPQSRAASTYRQPPPVAHERLAPRAKPAPKVAKKPAAHTVYEEVVPVGGTTYRERSGRVRQADTDLEAQYAYLDQASKSKAKARRLFNQHRHDTELDAGYTPTPERVSDRIQRKRRRSESTSSPDARVRPQAPEVIPQPRMHRAWLATELDSAGGPTGARGVQRPPPPGPQPLAQFVLPQWRSELRMQIQSALATRRKVPSSAAPSQSAIAPGAIPPGTLTVAQAQKTTAQPTVILSPAVPCRVGGV